MATYLRRVWTSNSGVIARGKRSTVLEFIDEEVDKTDEALEFGSLSGPENEQIGPDMSKFTLLEATYGIGECECSAKTW